MNGMETRAQILRRDQTDAERLLWQQLRNRGLAGFKFRRQRPIGAYIVDFVCLDAKLVIEVDGGQHAHDSLAHDRARTTLLAKEGYRVLRYWNNQVLMETEAVLEDILRSLNDPPHPNPLPKGKGNKQNSAKRALSPSPQRGSRSEWRFAPGRGEGDEQ